MSRPAFPRPAVGLATTTTDPAAFMWRCSLARCARKAAQRPAPDGPTAEPARRRGDRHQAVGLKSEDVAAPRVLQRRLRAVEGRLGLGRDGRAQLLVFGAKREGGEGGGV